AEEAKKKAEEEKAKAEGELEEKKTKETKTEVNTIADKLVGDKILAPADRDLFVERAMEDKAETKTYKIGDKEISPVDSLVKLMESHKLALKTEEDLEIGDIKGKDTENVHLRDKALKYAKEHKVTFREALIEVSPESKKEE
ncbi:unnamed protein product, partial [marine sediment metagenome]